MNNKINLQVQFYQDYESDYFFYAVYDYIYIYIYRNREETKTKTKEEADDFEKVRWENCLLLEYMLIKQKEFNDTDTYSKYFDDIQSSNVKMHDHIIKDLGIEKTERIKEKYNKGKLLDGVNKWILVDKNENESFWDYCHSNIYRASKSYRVTKDELKKLSVPVLTKEQIKEEIHAKGYEDTEDLIASEKEINTRLARANYWGETRSVMEGKYKEAWDAVVEKEIAETGDTRFVEEMPQEAPKLHKVPTLWQRLKWLFTD